VARRILIAAFGDPGHAFPAIALGRELVARGHEVCLETWSRWGEYVEAEGMRFAPAPDYRVGLRMADLKPYQAAVRASQETRLVVRDFDPDLVVVDILTVAGSLAAELEERPWASLVPHLFPVATPGAPLYSTGARPARTAVGRALWRAFDPLVRQGLEQGRAQLNGARARVGLPPVSELHGGLSRRLSLIATFPELEAWRPLPPWARVTGPLIWERPAEEDARAAPPGDDPLVLVAPSTSQDPEHRLIRASLAGLAAQPVRVLAATNGRPLPAGVRVPANARIADWPSYRRTMPECAAVICHGGHGTVAQALSAGVPVVCAPAAGDMAENAARVAWTGAGVSLPRRFATPTGVRLAVRRVLGDRRLRDRAAVVAQAANARRDPVHAAMAVESAVAHPVHQASLPSRPIPSARYRDGTVSARSFPG
jgi:UDP:flavonoid glycosyltransferase YjiC (YdhE family)